jgi:hypothetical protein
MHVTPGKRLIALEDVSLEANIQRLDSPINTQHSPVGVGVDPLQFNTIHWSWHLPVVTQPNGIEQWSSFVAILSENMNTAHLELTKFILNIF